jgi:outer membrane protein TolC
MISLLMETSKGWYRKIHRFKKVSLLLISCASILTGHPVRVFPVYARAVAPPRVGVGMVQRKLTLRQAIETALVNNLEIEIEKSNTATALQAVKGAGGIFDPTFNWTPGIQSRALPVSSVLESSDGKSTDRFLLQNFYFRQKLPWSGLSMALDFENNRQSTTNPFVSLNPFLTSRLFFNFTQPLLRNRLIDEGRAELKIRRKALDLSDVEFELRVIDVIARVQQAYWDLVAIRQDVEVNGEASELAQEQLARNQRMVQAGVLAPVELAASQAELERRRDTWYSSLGSLTEVENVLKSLLAESRRSPLWEEEIIPVDELVLEPDQPEDLKQAVGQALQQRAEVRQLGLRQQANEIQRQLNTDQVRPQLDLVASYGNTGLGGDLDTRENFFATSNTLLYERLNLLSRQAGLSPLPLPNFSSAPGILVGGYGTTLSNLFSGRYQTLQLGLAFDLNFRNRAAEANLAQTVIADRRIKLEQARIEQAIEAQVRNALQSIQTTQQRIAAAEAGSRAAKEKLESETRLFQTGESTNFLVLTRQNEYSDSRRRQVSARSDFNKAVARLEQALGNTLLNHKIVLK